MKDTCINNKKGPPSKPDNPNKPDQSDKWPLILKGGWMPKLETYSDRLLADQILSHKKLIEEIEKNEGTQDQLAEAKGWLEVLKLEKERRKLK